MIGEQVVDGDRAAELVQVAREIVAWMETMLPAEMRAPKSSLEPKIESYIAFR